MAKEIPYYTIDDEKSQLGNQAEAYIDDDDLKELLLELLGDDVSDEDIREILDAASDENLTEDEFDRLIDEFILKNKNWNSYFGPWKYNIYI